MKFSLDSLIQRLGQITQQLELLETAFTQVSWKVKQDEKSRSINLNQP